MKVYLVAFLDIIISMLVVVLVMVKPVDTKDLQPPGNLMIYTTWPDIIQHDDVDVWFLGPGMAKPIGYDNKDSQFCTLLKDDVGTDNKGMNFENIFCRSNPDGEYIVNLHGFSIDGPTVIHIQMIAWVNGVATPILDEDITLKGPKDEVTVIRFKMKDGKIVPGSIFHTFISLFDMKEKK